ncbi:MAG TPA: sugar transferase, partial [Clostridia bacterium]|nr:sugar transferase [Clostridia bacterium]
MQIHQVMDACLFAFSFFLAYTLRSSPEVIELVGLDPISSFENYVWLYLVLIPAAPMILEAQGFYSRPLLCSRRVTSWMLFKACLITTLGLVLTLFLSRMIIARWVVIWFGAIAFALVFAKEEIMRRFYKSRMGQSQYRRRFILVGSKEETQRMRAEIKGRLPGDMDFVAELSLSEMPVQRLVEMLHEHSINGVVVNAKRAYFDEVEVAIRACELEGVE